MRKARKAVKIAVDAVMYCLFLYLMCYRGARALELHALCGACLLGFFLLHHVLNYQWYKTLFGGRYRFKRTLLLVLDLLLLVVMGFMAVSSVMMLGAVVDWGISITQTGRELHVLSAAWGYVLAALHIGFHIHAPLAKAERKCRGSVFEYAVYLLLIALFVGGIYGFIRCGLWQDMFLIERPKTPLPAAWLYLSHVGTSVMFALLTHGVLLLHSVVRQGKSGR